MIEIYTTAACPKCIIVKGLLNKRGISFKEYKLTTQQEKEDFISKYNVRVVPFVIFNNEPIGGAEAASKWITATFKDY